MGKMMQSREGVFVYLHIKSNFSDCDKICGLSVIQMRLSAA